MPPQRVEAVNGSGWAFTTTAAVIFLGGCYYTFLAWTSPVPLSERLTVTAMTACAAFALPIAVHKIRRARRQARRGAEVLATGLRTYATVTAVTQTRTASEGHDPTVRITLRVMAPDGTSRSAWVSYELPIPMIVALRPGALLPVVLDVDDPRSAIIDWDNHRDGAEPDLPEVSALVERGELMAAVKAYRSLTGAGLKEAKDAVDRIAARRRS